MIFDTRRFQRDDNGTVLIEFAIVIGIFLFSFFRVLDFIRLRYTNIMAKKGNGHEP